MREGRAGREGGREWREGINYEVGAYGMEWVHNRNPSETGNQPMRNINRRNSRST